MVSLELAPRMAAVLQCANACSLRTGAARIASPCSVSSSGNGRKARAQARGVVSMALARSEEVEGCDARGVLRFAQKTVVALALGLSLSIGGQFFVPLMF